MATVHLKRWRGLVIGLVIVLVLGSAAAGYSYWRLDRNIQTVDLSRSIEPAARPPATPGRTLNVLVMGTDAGRSDTAMLVNISAAGDRARVISIPRDTMVPRPSCGNTPAVSVAMFNSAYTTGGPACVVKTVEAMTGVRIDHFVQIDFGGFERLIDAIGGVDVDLTTPIEDSSSGISLPAGTSHLNGRESLALVRTRYGIGDGSDLGRIQLQHQFLQALSKKIGEEKWLQDPKRTYELADAATKSIVTDSELGSIAKLADLASKLSRLQSSDITYLTMPNEPYPADHNRVQPKEPEADQLWQLLGGGAGN